jgi:hypothetical protein
MFRKLDQVGKTKGSSVAVVDLNRAFDRVGGKVNKCISQFPSGLNITWIHTRRQYVGTNHTNIS